MINFNLITAQLTQIHEKDHPYLAHECKMWDVFQDFKAWLISLIIYLSLSGVIVYGSCGGILVSLCPSVGLSVRPSVPHPVSALWRLQFWLDPFHIYTSYQATSEGVLCVNFLAKFKNVNFWQFFKICNFDFVLFWLGIWCESLVWVIMGRRGVSQNAGILVVLASLCCGLYSITLFWTRYFGPYYNTRADSRLAPSQWETSLQTNAVSHWLGTNLESVL